MIRIRMYRSPLRTRPRICSPAWLLYTLREQSPHPETVWVLYTPPGTVSSP